MSQNTSTKNFKTELLTLYPEYSKHFQLFVLLKSVNLFLYIFLFVSFLAFFFLFIVLEAYVLSEENFNFYLLVFGVSFLFNILLSFVSFQQQTSILKKLNKTNTPYATIFITNTIVLFFFLSTLLSATTSLFLTFLSFQIPYFTCIYLIEKKVKKECQKA